MSPIEKKCELVRPVAELQLSVVQHALPAMLPEITTQAGVHDFAYVE